MEIDLTYDEQPGLGSRFSLALGLQYNIILLLGAVSFSLALASPRPVEGALAAEVAWLLIAVVFPGVSRWIKKHNRRADEAADDPAGANLEDLQPDYRARGSALRHLNERIREGGRANTGVSWGELRSAMSRLDTIRQTFLQFAGTHQRLSQFLAGMQTANIDADVARVTDALYVEKDPTVKIGLRQALTLSQRRLHEREQVVNTLRGIEVQMSTIETAFVYIESIAAGASSGRAIESEIDALVARISAPDMLDAEVRGVLARASVAPSSMRPVVS